jgi:dihydrolipoamide dehydrogenase
MLPLLISRSSPRYRLGHAVKVGRFPFQANGKALRLADYGGWVKLMVNEKYGETHGAMLVGPEVTELLPELTLAEIARNVHAHPTLSEALMEAAHVAEGSVIHTGLSLGSENLWPNHQ